MNLKLDYKKTFLIGFGFFGISVLWTLYNAYVPIYLQAGNPTFNAPGEVGFGLGAGLTGVIMTLDNVAALFLLPLIGLWSDRIWTRLGRRLPFILVLAPIAIAAFILIPIAVRMVPPELSGQVDRLGTPLALFMVAVGVFLLAMAGFRTPVIALMPDLTPSPLRSQANGVINLMGGVGTLIATLGSGLLYGMGRMVPFAFGGVLMAAAVLMLLFFVREPREFEAAAHEDEGLGALRGIKRVSPEARRSLGLLMAAIFCWFVGYNAVETFLSSYGVSELGMSVGRAPLLMGVASLTFLIFAIPAGYIAARFGRRRTIITGLAIFGVLLMANFFLRNATLVWPIIAIGGMGWALVNINSLPMVVDISASDADLGTYTGLYYIASQLAAIFCWFVGYNAVETFLSSYGVSELGMSVGRAPLLMGVASLTFLIFAIPSGYIAARFGRRRTIITGLAIFGVLLMANFFLRNATLVWPIIAIGGMGWALVNINSLPMVVDISASDADLGTYTGLYYIASQLAAIAGPAINGYIVEWGGGNYNLIFLVTPAFFLLAILCMLGVTKGEAKSQAVSR